MDKAGPELLERPREAPALRRTVIEYARPLTVEDFELLSEGEGKRELHDGRVVEMAPVGLLHGDVAGELVGRLRDYVRAHGGPRLGRAVTETGYVLWPDLRPKESRAPDVSFLSAARTPRPYPRRGLVRAVPDLAAEVLSPDDAPDEVLAKVEEYLDAGVRLVWVIDPFRGATVHRTGRSPEALGLEGVLSGEDVLPGLAVPLAELWPVLDEEEAPPGGSPT